MVFTFNLTGSRLPSCTTFSVRQAQTDQFTFRTASSHILHQKKKMSDAPANAPTKFDDLVARSPKVGTGNAKGAAPASAVPNDDALRFRRSPHSLGTTDVIHAQRALNAQLGPDAFAAAAPGDVHRKGIATGAGPSGAATTSKLGAIMVDVPAGASLQHPPTSVGAGSSGGDLVPRVARSASDAPIVTASVETRGAAHIAGFAPPAAVVQPHGPPAGSDETELDF